MYVCACLCVCVCVSVSTCVRVCVRDRQTQSAKSYNCGSILQAQSPVPAPLIQHTHCTFSRSMIPLCLTHAHSLPPHIHTYAHSLSTVNKHTPIYTFNPSHFNYPSLLLCFSHIRALLHPSLSFPFHLSFSLRP